jgi:hypothetical protein
MTIRFNGSRVRYWWYIELIHTKGHVTLKCVGTKEMISEANWYLIKIYFLPNKGKQLHYHIERNQM